MTEPTQDELLILLSQWENRLHETRSALMVASRELKEKRGKVAECIQLWQTNGIKLTPAELTKQHLASEKELRRMRAAGEIVPKVIATAPGYMDRVGAYAHSGDPNDFVRKQMRTGHRRGGLTATQAAAANADRIRRRLPSER